MEENKTVEMEQNETKVVECKRPSKWERIKTVVYNHRGKIGFAAGALATFIAGLALGTTDDDHNPGENDDE